MSTVFYPAEPLAGEHAANTPHSTPRAAAVLREQFRAVGVAARGEMVVAGVLMLGVTVLMVLYHVNWGSGGFDMLDMRMPLFGLGLFAPLAVWRNEAPSRRGYLWALPVDRSRNTLARLLGGWSWVMLVAAALMLWSLGATLAANGGLGNDLAAPHGEPWMLLLPFTGATVAYLIGSTVVLATDYPWRWTAGGIFLFGVLLQLTEAMRDPWLERLLTSVFAGRYGLISVATGTVGVRTRAASGAIDFRMVPDQQAWLVATLIWSAIAFAAVLAAAYRHQER
ncbi:MAG TPA: hypothetical protein VFS20_29010 [Longimicrobium sp.]|nr:hypothetical protein [Longimicrobium sp.]